jgi:hypothetical protein
MTHLCKSFLMEVQWARIPFCKGGPSIEKIAVISDGVIRKHRITFDEGLQDLLSTANFFNFSMISRTNPAGAQSSNQSR